MSILIALAAAAGSPQPGELKTFSDWIVGCDNGRACQAVALMPEDGSEATTMIIRRGAESQAPILITIDVRQDEAAALLVDGKRLPLRPGGGSSPVEASGAAAATFIDAFRPARRLSVIDARGKEVGAPSLNGLSAALLYIDEQQNRVNTVTAFVRKGSARAIPAPPALPVIVAPPVSAAPPRKLTAGDIARTLKPLECETSETSAGPTYARLDAATSLALLPAPCGNGAYNYYSYALLIDNAGKVRPAGFDAQAGMGGEDPSQIDNMTVNSDWDAKARRLTTYAKGRGIGDCGSISEFAWDGKRFRLSKLELMGECRGSTDYIPVWRAVVR